MRVHHLDCGALCPLGGKLMDGFSSGFGDSHLSCHCLLIETARSGLVLIDTGLGLEDIRNPRPRLSSFFMAMCRPTIHPAQTAFAQVQRLGFSPEDVRHIVLTHLDFDHAGGIDDFPNATIHLLAAEKEAALERSGWIARGRYRPEQFRRHELWQTYGPGKGESWFNFSSATALRGLPPEILLVPLRGHTLGHAGIAVETSQGWLLHAGDAYFYHEEKFPEAARCTPGLRAYQLMMDTDRAQRRANQERIRELVRRAGSQVQVFCAHDFLEYQELKTQVHEASFTEVAA